LGFFSSARVNAFAKTMAERVSRCYPPIIANNQEQTVAPERVAEILEMTLSGASRFQQESQLGLLGRAKLGNAFRWELREIGYEEKFVGLATEKLFQQLTSRTGEPSA
jgi:hypothetical protein